jgi:acyl-CoA synthetase (NDP forming)
LIFAYPNGILCRGGGLQLPPLSWRNEVSMDADIRTMFYPESVAVVGASANPRNMGRNIVQNLITWEYPGKVYPVNPRGEEVLGLKGYKSLEDIEGPVDLAVAFVPASAVPGVMDQCDKKGIKLMAIPSGGFSEYGEEGAKLTRAIREKAEAYGMRFVGPNGLTLINAENGLCLPFPTFRKRAPGRISIISQSGGVGMSLIMFLDNSHSSFNKFVSVGNKVNMDELDFLEFLGSDPGTSVICMFLESVVRGREFIEVASRIDKPVLVYKANTTEVGAKTAASHTAALANNDMVVDGALKQAGVIRVDEIQKLMDMARAFEMPRMRGNRIAVVSQAGGYTVMLSDEAYRQGFVFPPLAESLVSGFKEYARSDVIRLGNPLDRRDPLRGRPGHGAGRHRRRCDGAPPQVGREVRRCLRRDVARALPRPRRDNEEARQADCADPAHAMRLFRGRPEQDALSCLRDTRGSDIGPGCPAGLLRAAPRGLAQHGTG